jgi:hypothetical protein
VSPFSGGFFLFVSLMTTSGNIVINAPQLVSFLVGAFPRVFPFFAKSRQHPLAQIEGLQKPLGLFPGLWYNPFEHTLNSIFTLKQRGCVFMKIKNRCCNRKTKKKHLIFFS